MKTEGHIMTTTTSGLDALIEKLESQLPDICSATDIVDTGLCSFATLHRARNDGNGPAFFQMHKKRFLYLKPDVITWIKNRYNNGNMEIENDSR